MSQTNFKCDVCGREFPAAQMKEFFDESGTRMELCAEDLDRKMNEAGKVRGGPGEEKRAAAYAEDGPKNPPYGERVAPS
ncbi:MAG TPA: hypothetical protein VM754_06410 [Actinomycetota bacterium]|jgi:predicted nucleic acid-binding Zn ribbon protein|nr:hypothetical protein [Actinomycetota bacterium]